MSNAIDAPTLPAILTAALLLAGAATTLIGSLGLLRFQGFYERVHAPTLGSTLGTAFVALASIIHFSAAGGRPVVHELLLIVFVTVTTPITLMILVGAATSRDEFENGGKPPGRVEDGRR